MINLETINYQLNNRR